MASIRDLNRKISSLRNMQKVMSAMNMIASTKFSKLLTKQMALLKFRDALNRVRASLFLRISRSSSPVVTGNDGDGVAHVIIFTADRGLCGAHNNSIFKGLEKLIKRLAVSPDDFEVTSIGSRGAKYCRKKEYVLFHSVDINEKTLHDSDLLRISETTFKRFKNGEIESVHIIYNHFVSALTQTTTTDRILPIKIEEKEEKDDDSAIVEMTSDLGDEKLVESAAPLLVFYQLKTALLDSYLSENGARMTAMENASNNSQDLINRYAKIKNRARQTAITNELSEIVSGKEAMKE